MWANALSSFVKCSPADCYVFDVVARNSEDISILPVWN